MSVLFEVVEGWTGVLGPFTLRVNEVPLDLTSYTVELVLRSGDGTLISVAGQVTKLNQVANPGQVTFSPAAGDFVHQTGRYTRSTSYQMHWKATDGSGKVVFFPNDDSLEVVVNRA